MPFSLAVAHTVVVLVPASVAPPESLTAPASGVDALAQMAWMARVLSTPEHGSPKSALLAATLQELLPTQAL